MPTSSELQTGARVSIVIPTLNRGNLLLQTVTELLSSHSEALLELVVVDQSTAANEAVRAVRHNALTYHHVDFQCLPKARNYGIVRTKGDIVLFLDDDVTSLARIVDAHAEAHRRTGADAVTGPVLAPGQRLVKIEQLPEKLRTEVLAGNRLHQSVDAEFAPQFTSGCNMSFKRFVFERFGMFDENFIGNAIGEDAEMCSRILRNSGKLIYVPACALVHLTASEGGCRDESDTMRRVATQILNTHYFVTKIGRGRSFPAHFWGLLRIYVFNKSNVTTLAIKQMTQRLLYLTFAWRSARMRTRALMRQRKQHEHA